jgi:hypothetical protein
MPNPIYEFIKNNMTKIAAQDIRPLSSVVSIKQIRLQNARRNISVIFMTPQIILEITNKLNSDPSLISAGVSVAPISSKCSLVAHDMPCNVQEPEQIACHLGFGYRLNQEPEQKFVNILYNIDGQIIVNSAFVNQNEATIYSVLLGSNEFIALNNAVSKLFEYFKTQQTKSLRPDAPVFTPLASARAIASDELHKCKKFAGLVVVANNVNPLEVFKHFFPADDFKQMFLFDKEAAEAENIYAAISAEKHDFSFARGLIYKRLRELNCETKHLEFIQSCFVKLRDIDPTHRLILDLGL